MGLFRALRTPVISGGTVYLRAARGSDYAAWAQVRGESRMFLEPWEPIWPADDLTRLAFRRRLRRQAADFSREEALSLLVFRGADDQLMGGLTIGHIRRGVAQTATIGYWMGAAYAGKGYMGEALAATVDYAFTDMRLRRLEAACLPNNTRSIALLERTGFQREGRARAYLRIAGHWRDHYLYALLDHDPRARVARS